MTERNQLLPREKAITYGLEYLSDEELLALLLQSGGKGISVFEMVEKLLTSCGGLKRLATLSYEELISIKGIKQSKAYKLLALFEIYRRLSLVERIDKYQLNNPHKIATWLRLLIGSESQEKFMVLFLNSRYELLKYEILFIGDEKSSLVSLKELMRKALLYRSNYLVVAHNHPSGNCLPSNNDKLMTNKLKKACEYLGIGLLDHLIVSSEDYYSFAKEKLL